MNEPLKVSITCVCPSICNSNPHAANPRNSSSLCGGLSVAISRDNFLNMNSDLYLLHKLRVTTIKRHHTSMPGIHNHDFSITARLTWYLDDVGAKTKYGTVTIFTMNVIVCTRYQELFKK